MPPRSKVDVVADAVRPLLSDTKRADEAGHAVIGALMSAGYSVVRERIARVPAKQRVGRLQKQVFSR